MNSAPTASSAPAPLNIGPDGYVHRPHPSDQYILNGRCPNRCGPMQSTPGRQRCPACGYNTNTPPAVER